MLYDYTSHIESLVFFFLICSLYFAYRITWVFLSLFFVLRISNLFVFSHFVLCTSHIKSLFLFYFFNSFPRILQSTVQNLSTGVHRKNSLYKRFEMNLNSIIWRGSYGNWRKYVFSSSLPEGFRRLFSLAQYKLLRIYLTGSPTPKLEKKFFLKLET